MFIDNIEIYVKAGDGGNGAVSFHREKYVSAGGPDGGDGGKGGNIILKVDEGANTLLAFRYKRKFVAEPGGNGMAGKMHGKNGKDVIIPVPRGTLIRDKESGRIIFDMAKSDEYVLCKGGRGGWGNRHFATPTRRAPRFAKNGLEGEAKELLLELKMLADVGFVGLPNVGKSTLLSMISAARPKIANYHFTTLAPMLGVVSVDDNAFVAADIPGLIEGASEGLGLGHDFLRHVDRCRLLVHVVDIAGSEGRDPIEDIEMINDELLKYSVELAERPQIIAANKCDILDPETADEAKARLEKYAAENGFEVIYISAASGENVKPLCRRVYEMLQELPPLTIYEAEEQEVIEEPQNPDDLTITKQGKDWIVEGEWLKWLMSGINFDDRESFMYFEKMIRDKGIIQKMREAGIADGDSVILYDLEFDFVD